MHGIQCSMAKNHEEKVFIIYQNLICVKSKTSKGIPQVPQWQDAIKWKLKLWPQCK